MKNLLFVISVSLTFLFFSCAVKVEKNVSYLEKTASENSLDKPTLNVFSPKKMSSKNLPVLIFVHGGNWNSGKKELYNFFGKNFAKKGIVTVIVGYTLSPDADYKKMTAQVSQAIKWTKKNISEYKGDPDKIFLTGHSAGGHLVTLAALDNKYGIDPNSISGIILNDAAGLDMHHYLSLNPPTSKNDYLTTWSNDPKIWQLASPINYVDNSTPPMLIYLGAKTYPSIKTANKRFLGELRKYQPEAEVDTINKKHIPMMTQYFWPWNNRYKEIIDFINKND